MMTPWFPYSNVIICHHSLDESGAFSNFYKKIMGHDDSSLLACSSKMSQVCSTQILTFPGAGGAAGRSKWKRSAQDALGKRDGNTDGHGYPRMDTDGSDNGEALKYRVRQ